MTPKRPRLDRLVAWAPVLLLGGLAAFTYWLDAQVESSGRRNDGSSRHDPDLYIERFNAVTFDVDGRVRQMLAANRAEHFPDDGSVDLMGPALELTDPGKPRIAVTADKGTVSGDRETVTLRGHVHATRDAAEATPRDTNPLGAATFTTEKLRDHSEGGARRNRRARDDRGGAWNNPGRRDGPRQQRAHRQAQIRRARNPPTEQAAEVNLPMRNRIAARRGAGAAAAALALALVLASSAARRGDG